jgi:hypothetical protein
MMSNVVNHVSFGSDPEFFLSLGGYYKSAIDVVPGSIGNRHKIGDHQFYWDNVLAECAVKPGNSKQEVVDNVRDCLRTYARLVKPFTLEPRPSADMLSHEIKDKRAKVVGCHPDVCAYTTKSFKPDKKIMRTPFRSGGGHIHLGAPDGFLYEDGPKRVLLVYLMDLFLAIPSLSIEMDPSSPARRAIYGHAGRYRPTSYGVEDTPGYARGIEYRPLSNFWFQCPQYVELIYDLTMFVVNMVENDECGDFWEMDEDKFYQLGVRSLHKAFKPKYDVELLQRCIRESDEDAAEPLFMLAWEKLPEDLKDRVLKFTLVQWCGRQICRDGFNKWWGIDLG